MSSKVLPYMVYGACMCIEHLILSSATPRFYFESDFSSFLHSCKRSNLAIRVVCTLIEDVQSSPTSLHLRCSTAHG